MKDSSSDSAPTSDPSDEDLLSLAFDCTEMVTKLSKGYEMEREGDHDSAMAAIGSVEGRIDDWMEKIDRLDPDGVDKDRLFQDLEEAKEALELD